jgi:hypothetical protein
MQARRKHWKVCVYVFVCEKRCECRYDVCVQLICNLNIIDIISDSLGSEVTVTVSRSHDYRYGLFILATYPSIKENEQPIPTLCHPVVSQFFNVCANTHEFGMLLNSQGKGVLKTLLCMIGAFYAFYALGSLPLVSHRDLSTQFQAAVH